MLIDKEYPATHSMLTSWYMVDDDGNIAIMQGDDNGPVPFGVREEYFADSMFFGESLDDNEICGAIELTKEQIEETLGQSRAPKDITSWWEIVVEIDTSRRQEFLQIVEDSPIHNYGCVSESLGLYKIDVAWCTDDNYAIIKGSALDRLVSSGIIRSVYRIPELNLDCKYNEATKEYVFTKEFENNSYYLYTQPYWPQIIQKRVHIPRYPVKIEQVHPDKREKILRIPGKFSEIEYMQIAEWYPCAAYSVGETVDIDGCDYALFPMADGTEKYVLTHIPEWLKVSGDNPPAQSYTIEEYEELKRKGAKR